jgi:hypothetical protein
MSPDHVDTEYRCSPGKALRERSSRASRVRLCGIVRRLFWLHKGDTPTGIHPLNPRRRFGCAGRHFPARLRRATKHRFRATAIQQFRKDQLPLDLIVQGAESFSSVAECLDCAKTTFGPTQSAKMTKASSFTSAISLTMIIVTSQTYARVTKRTSPHTGHASSASWTSSKPQLLKMPIHGSWGCCYHALKSFVVRSTWLVIPGIHQRTSIGKCNR